MILSLREFANATLESGVLPAAAELDVHGKAPGQVAMETLWSCRTCMACVEICPVAVEHVPIIVQMRRKLVEDGAMDPLLTKTLQTIHKTGNSFGESKRKRGAWSKALPFKVKDARKEPVEVLWFVGDYASFDPRNQRVTQTFAALLREAGVDFGILYDGESNAGNDVRRVGEEGLYEVLAGANVAALASASFKTIVTTDPHSYNTIRNEYPDFGGSYRIQHYTSFLRGCSRAASSRSPGRSSCARPSMIRVTSGASTRDTKPRAKCSSSWAARSSKWAAPATTPSVAGRAAAESGFRIRWERRSRLRIASKKQPRFRVLKCTS